MKKIMGYLFFVLIICGCGSINDDTTFKNHVIDPIPSSVKNIHMVKDHSAMHGALFFDFEGSEEDAGLIIQKNGLLPEKEIPTAIKSILSNAPWANEINSGNTRIFGKIEHGKYEWHALYVFMNKGKTYCLKI